MDNILESWKKKKIKMFKINWCEHELNLCFNIFNPRVIGKYTEDCLVWVNNVRLENGISLQIGFYRTLSPELYFFSEQITKKRSYKGMARVRWLSAQIGPHDKKGLFLPANRFSFFFTTMRALNWKKSIIFWTWACLLPVFSTLQLFL